MNRGKALLHAEKMPPDENPDSPATLEAELRMAWESLSDAYRRFNQAADPELVESCVFRINAEKALCDYLLRAMKSHCSNGHTRVIMDRTAGP